MGRTAHTPGIPDVMALPVHRRGRSGMHQVASPVDDLIWNLAEDLAATAWMARGRCGEVDPDIFFPEKGGSSREARIVCRGCEVRETCLAYALEHGEKFGVWGGLSERERPRLKDAAA